MRAGVGIKLLAPLHPSRTDDSLPLLSQGGAGQLCAGTLRSLRDLPHMRQVSWAVCIHVCFLCIRVRMCDSMCTYFAESFSVRIDSADL